MLPGQAIETQCLFNVVFYPAAQLRVALAPFLQPRRDVLAGFLQIPPVVNPPQFLQAVIIGFPRQVVEGVPEKVNVTALPHRLREGLPESPYAVRRDHH